jgi:hypothetical protein
MNHKRQLWVVVLSLLLWCGTSVAATYPVRVSTSNPRILVDQNNVPFLMVGDSPQALIVNLTESQAKGYFADRSAHGFNTVWINLLCDEYTGGRTNGSTIDGILPFKSTIPSTASYDLTTPNETYFARVDFIVHLAAHYGIQVLLDPIETGGWLQTMLDNGSANCLAYGQYLGNRYKNFPNIIWLSGNDFQTWRDGNSDSVVSAVALGIQGKDIKHIHTVELDYPVSSSLDDGTWAPIISLNGAYTYFPTYAEVLQAYNQSSSMPVFMIEAHYDLEQLQGDTGTPPVLRRQEYWAMLSGASGQLYGNHFTWQFIAGWQTNLDTPGAIQIGYMNSLFQSRAWYDLVPDTNHTVVTAGPGLADFSTSGNVSGNDYLTAASAPDGTLAIAYIPTLGTNTVDMSKFSAAVTAWWFDPAGGTYSSVPGSPFPNSGTVDFTPPGNNSDGDGDWVLVIETKPPPVSPPLGTYNGLFSETDQVRQNSSGFLTASVTARARYSGRLQIGANRYSLSGTLGPQVQITNRIVRRNDSPLTLDLHFGISNGAAHIFGQITNDTWVATLLGDRAVFNSRTNPAPYTNRYTLLIPGQDGDALLPAGNGFGSVLVDANGRVTFAGTLADGTKVSQSVPLSRDGTWPLYVSLYAGGGSIWSWLDFASPGSSDINGTLSWIKLPDVRARYYSNGFTNGNETVVGSVYSPPAGSNILNLTNALVQFSGGDLLLDFSNPVALGLRSRVTNLSSSNRLTMAFSLATGTFAGGIRDPSTGRTWSFGGAVLQNLGAGYGFLLETNQSSQVVFTP